MLPPLAGVASDIGGSRDAEEDIQEPQQKSSLKDFQHHAHHFDSSAVRTDKQMSDGKAHDRMHREADGAGVNFNPPHSSYSVSALPESAQNYGTAPSGTIGQHHPKEIVRVERDWSGGEVCQFHSSYPMELEGRITPKEFRTLIDEVNSHLQQAYSQRAAVMENILAILTWHTSLFWWTSKFEKELRKVESTLEESNKDKWHQRGLRFLSPREVALQYLEIEYGEYLFLAKAFC